MNTRPGKAPVRTMRATQALLVVVLAALLWGAWMFRFDCTAFAGRLVCYDRWTHQRVLR